MMRKVCLILALVLTPVLSLGARPVFAATAVTPNLQAALAPRTLGDPKAPVKVDEYASLSCPHCARFSKDVFDAFKAKYIDTGKVFYTYHDFPLNPPALVASMVARCLPADRYFQFTKFLFDTQDRWVVENYQNVLRGDAKLLGMSDAEFNSCVGDDALRGGLVGQMQAEQAKEKIDSTPTFIINGLQHLSGEQSLDGLGKIIDPLVGPSKAK